MTGGAPATGVPALPRPPRWTKDPPPRLVASPAVDDLVGRLASGVDAARALAGFWSGVDDRGTPLVDPADAADERVVTFLHRDRHGTGPGTRRVVLIANKLTDPSLPRDSALERVPGTDVWWRAYRLSAAWRGTYAVAADDAEHPADDELPARGRWGGVGGRAGRDPRNPRTFPGPGGDSELSLLELPAAPEQPWSTLPAGAPRGTVEEVRVPGPGGGDERRAWVHVPAVRPQGPQRLLVLLDGADWTGRRDAPAILDALHHAGRIPPTITLLVDSGTGPARTADLASGDPFLDHLVVTLPEWMRRRHPVGPGRGHLVLAGESMGGVAVLRAAARRPDLVGGVVVQSASLWWGGQEAADRPSPTVELLRGRPPASVRVHLRVGRDEWILLDAHRALRGVLEEAGVAHRLVEYEGGHDAVCWRGGLADGLIDVLAGGPGEAA